ncbi:MAG: right-handed parallel beta-helix repeat-containing protein [Lewinellaceae bacterium]|nr:right-handed parallel beta-helix repeat-containing protein [Lewinellaceae bacterium]
MNKISTFFKLGAMALVCLTQSVNIIAQTTLISPTGDGGFENGGTFAANGWTEVNGATNNWFLGAVSTPSAGANAAYVSNDVAGATYTYTVTTANTVHFYRDVTFPAGEPNIVLTFKWKAGGESSWDYVTVYSMPTSNTPVVNSPAGAFQSWLNIPVAYPGAVVHCTPPNLNLQSGAYQTQTICLPAGYAGTTRRLVFMWSNDGSGGAQPPASVDEISLVSSLPPSGPANSPTALSLNPISVSQIDGSFTAAIGAPDGYLTVRYPTGAMPSNPVNGTTYLPGAALGLGTVVSSSALTTFSATGLTPSTTYDFYVYSYNSAPCASGPLYKTTAPLFGTAATLACPSLAAGTYTVGPTGTFASLTAVTAALANGTAGPVIFELQPTYLSTVETFPITFLGSPCPYIGGVTIRPQAGAVALSITDANATGTININGASNITFDGRAGGVGLSQLTIENTSLTGYAFQFINSARFNTLKFCTFRGVNTGTASGVIVFSTATGLPMGNSNNTIDNCDIRDGATTPTNLVYATGTTTSYNSQNNNNTISNSLLHDWFNASSTTAGAAINVVTGCSDWTITNNSFYQSVPRTFTMTSATDQGAIFINSTVFGFNFTITNNFVGGSAALCASTPWTYTGGATGTPTPRLIRISTSIGSPFNTISNNTIRNIAITSSSTSTAHSLISHLNGNININNNTIGSQSALNDITFTLASTSTAPFFLPISAGTGASVSMINITNNNIGGINVNSTSTGAVSFRVIYAQPPALSKVTVSGNTIGGTVANSIRQQTGGATSGNGILAGIMILNPTIGDVVTNNLIRNLTQDNTLAGGVLWHKCPGKRRSTHNYGEYYLRFHHQWHKHCDKQCSVCGGHHHDWQRYWRKQHQQQYGLQSDQYEYHGGRFYSRNVFWNGPCAATKYHHLQKLRPQHQPGICNR